MVFSISCTPGTSICSLRRVRRLTPSSLGSTVTPPFGGLKGRHDQFAPRRIVRTCLLLSSKWIWW